MNRDLFPESAITTEATAQARRAALEPALSAGRHRAWKRSLRQWRRRAAALRRGVRLGT